ncbi:hypothetical protein LCGC14_0662750 [marine sediment metagenome]|uniref:Uncharacterized protein n=1 Tax=marine sediment metagenome TaxID=412755 RepID=A0A0F9QT32_9ZZZZ
MAIQNEEQFVTVTVHDGTIELKSPRFGDYLDYAMADEKDEGDEEDVREKIAKSTATRERFLAMAEKLIVCWSYPEPVTQENIAHLDSRASLTLLTELNKLLGVGEETEGEAKKAVTA